VLATAKYMLDAKLTEVNFHKEISKKSFVFSKDEVLRYIDEQICSRFTDSEKTNCKKIIETDGKDLLNNIECGIVRRKICNKLFDLFLLII
jgi:hypothetical protein